MRKEFLYLKNPQPGETIYSLACRIAFSFGSGNGNLLERLTGQQRTTSLLSTLPGYIRSISEIAPESHEWSNSERIVTENTQLPYFTYFDNPETRNRVIQNLACSDDSYPIAMALGLTIYPLPASPRHPRYCFHCLKDDLGNCPTTYFHREHQLPGVSVCWLHGEPLHHGCEFCGAYPIVGNNLAVPGCCNCDEIISPLLAHENIQGNREVHKWLAEQSAVMVNSRGTSCDNVRGKLKQVAIARGLSRGRKICYVKLATAIEKRYGRETLTWLKTPAWKDGRPAPWVRRLLHDRVHEIKRSPAIYFLLFIGTLFDSLENFERQGVRQPSIALNVTINGSENDGTKPPKITDDHTTQILAICEDPLCGIPGIADRLGTTQSVVLATLKKHERSFPLTQATIKRLGQKNLNAIRNDLRSGKDKKEIQDINKCSSWTLGLIELDDPDLVFVHREASRRRKIENHRNILVNLIGSRPSISKSEVQSLATGTYEYLQKYDPDWFEEILPRKRPDSNSDRSALVDWDERDRQKEKEIKDYLESEEYNNKPVWTTISHLLKKVGMLSMYHSNKVKFPVVERLVTQRKETRSTFTKRKLRWAIIKMRDSRQELSLNKLRRVAGFEAAVIRAYSSYIFSTATEVGAEIAEKSFFLKPNLEIEPDQQEAVSV